MDGFQLQKKLNTLKSRLQVIFITAHAQADDRERAMESGAKGFLEKPFDDKSLLNLISLLTSKD